MALMKVFYEDWQMGCCGDPFSVGDRVGWNLVPVKKAGDPGCGYGAGAWVENHGGRGPATEGTVRAVELVHVTYLYRPEESPTHQPVPGSVTLEAVDACPKWFTPDTEEPDTEEPDVGEPGIGKPGTEGPGAGKSGTLVHRTSGALVTLEVPDAPAGPPRPAPRARRRPRRGDRRQ
ncbi:DUF6578 domain-containing protein [Streptomyces sp. NPDC005435]|uniref:DUF6578 domain-containing protein n=1 Tax=Streptomyces sp. NPDC005435 TaxID=3154464 RepID=UPI0034520EBF